MPEGVRVFDSRADCQRKDREDLGQVVRPGEGNLLLVAATPQVRLELLALLGRHHVEDHLHVGDAVNCAHRCGHLTGDRVAHGAPGHGEQHLDVGRARIVDVYRADHAEFGDGALDLGVVDGGQRGLHRVEERA